MHDDHTKSKDCKNSHEIYRNEGKEMREREIIKTEIGKHFFFPHTREWLPAARISSYFAWVIYIVVMFFFSLENVSNNGEECKTCGWDDF